MDLGPGFLLSVACGVLLIGLGALLGYRAGQVCLLLGTVLAGATIVWLLIDVVVS